jgi:hypothetical protein
MAASGKYGYFNKNADTSELNYWEPVFVPANLTPDILYREQRKFFIKFYSRPHIILRQIKKIKRPAVLKRLGVTLLKILTAPRKKENKARSESPESGIGKNGHLPVSEPGGFNNPG